LQRCLIKSIVFDYVARPTGSAEYAATPSSCQNILQPIVAVSSTGNAARQPIVGRQSSSISRIEPDQQALSVSRVAARSSPTWPDGGPGRPWRGSGGPPCGKSLRRQPIDSWPGLDLAAPAFCGHKETGGGLGDKHFAVILLPLRKILFNPVPVRSLQC
jgi:hypothetical protein